MKYLSKDTFWPLRLCVTLQIWIQQNRKSLQFLLALAVSGGLWVFFLPILTAFRRSWWILVDSHFAPLCMISLNQLFNRIVYFQVKIIETMSSVEISRPSASVAPASLPQSKPLPPPPLVDGRSLSGGERWLSGGERWGCAAGDASADAGWLMQGSCCRRLGSGAYWARCSRARCRAARLQPAARRTSALSRSCTCTFQ